MAEILKGLREKQARLVANARSKLDEIKDDTPAERGAEILREHEAIMAEFDGLQGQVDAEVRQAEIEEAQRRAAEERRPTPPNKDVRNEDPDAAKAHKAAFDAYLRGGINALPPEQRALIRPAPNPETRAQGVATGSAGDYLVPQGFMRELMVSLKLAGPMMDDGFVRVLETDTGNTLPWPKLDDTANEGALIAENTQVSGASLAFGSVNLLAYKFTSNVVLVSRELLQDAAIDPEEIVRDAMGIRIGRVGNQYLTTGSGSSQPTGITVSATKSFTMAADSAISFDDMIGIEHSLDPMYRTFRDAKWQFNDTTLKSLRLLKDANGRYLWQPAAVSGAVDGSPATILDYPYAVNQAMASPGSTGAIPVIFGAHKRYVHRRVREFILRRLDERYADYDQVGFIGFMRMDGNQIDADAITTGVNP